MLRHIAVFLATVLPFLLTCGNPSDPFSDDSNSYGSIFVSSESGKQVDSLFVDSTARPILISATIFLTEFIDSGFAQVCYNDGSCDRILDSLFAEDDVEDNRTLDTSIAFGRGGAITVRLKVYLKNGTNKTDSALLFLHRTPVKLDSLTISDAALTPDFNDSTFSYTSSVPNEQNVISLTPVTNNPFISMVINDDTLSSESTSASCSLSVGENSFTVITIADDDSTTLTYSLTVTREPGTIATLDSIELSAGILDPTFDTLQFSGYTAEVVNTVDSLTLTAYPTHPGASVSIDSGGSESGISSFTVPLAVGDNKITLTVTAEDDSTVKKYQLTVVRKKSTDATLSTITLSKGTLQPEFHPDSLNYRLIISHDIDSFTLTPEATHTAATVSILDSLAATDDGWICFPLTGVDDTITMPVTAQDGKTKRQYRLFVNRPPDTDAHLLKINLSEGKLSPVFHPDSLRYTVSLPFADSVVKITPVCADENAVATIGGDTVPQTVTFPTGTDSIEIILTAEDEKTKKHYIILFERTRSNNAALSLLTISAGTLTPAFDPDIEEYTATVEEQVDKITVTAHPRHDQAQIKINSKDTPASITLESMATTPVAVVVTAENGTRKKTYTVMVTRKGSSEAALAGITVSAGKLFPPFNSDSLTYELRVPSDSEKVRVLPIPAHDRVSVTVKGNSVSAGSWSNDIAVVSGKHTSFNIVVTSENGKQRKTYSIIVNRAYPLTITDDGNGTTDPDGTIDAFISVPAVLTAQPATGFHFDSWAIVAGTATLSSENDDETNVLIQSATSVEARFERNRYQLTVTSNGNGTVTGTDSVDSGTPATITATPASGYHLYKWDVISGTLTISDSTATSTTVTVENGNAAIQALFAINSYTLTVTGDDNGTVTGSGPVDHGVARTITAMPNDHHHFVEWTVTDGTAEIDNTTEATTTVTLTGSDADITATFTIDEYALTITHTGNGTVTESGTAVHGTPFSINANPATGFHFVEWQVTNGTATIDDAGEISTTVILESGDATVEAVFVLNTHRLTTDSRPAEGGTIGASKDPPYSYGDEVTLTAIPAAGYRFDGWSGDTSTNVDVLQLIIDRDRTIHARFIRCFTLSITISGGSGTISPSETATIDSGNVQEISAVPASGYRFNGWSGDTTTNEPMMQITMEKDMAISAEFIRVFNLTVSLDGNGSVDPSGTITVDSGAATSISATLGRGYKFSTWATVAGTPAISDTSTIATSVVLQNGDASIKAVLTVYFKVFGGTLSDGAYSLQRTDDDGFIIGGIVRSFGVNASDCYVIKTDQYGDSMWTRTYDILGNDILHCIRTTDDGGYVMSGASGPTTTDLNDALLVKLSSTGAVEFSETYGYGEWERGYTVQQMSDGGYLLGGDIYPGGAPDDVSFIKTNSLGDTLWRRVIGGSSYDAVLYLEETFDNGFIAVGGTSSYGQGNGDIYLLKYTENGTLQWTRTIGGTEADAGTCVKQLSDSGYVISGLTASYGAGGRDVYLVRTNSTGNVLWSKTFGSDGDDEGRSLVLTSDGGFLIAGYTTTSHGDADVFVIKTTSSGDAQWTKNFGGSRYDGIDFYSSNCVENTSDGGYAIVGATQSFGAGSNDAFLLLLDANGEPVRDP